MQQFTNDDDDDLHHQVYIKGDESVVVVGVENEDDQLHHRLGPQTTSLTLILWTVARLQNKGLG